MDYLKTAKECRKQGEVFLQAATALEALAGKKKPGRAGRVISIAGRARISQAQKARWAKLRRAA